MKKNQVMAEKVRDKAEVERKKNEAIERIYISMVADLLKNEGHYGVNNKKIGKVL